MSENLKNGLLALIAIATIANTIILLGDSGVSYEKTPVKSAVSNVAATPASSINASMTPDNQQQQMNQNQAPVGPKTTIEFASLEHDFGTIEQNTHNPKTFTFTNTGDKPLIISNAKGSCGCTVPNYPREPIAPGQTGEIEVVYNPGTQRNQQVKTISITANTEPATTVLQVKANVIPGEGGDDEGQNVMIGG